MTDKKKERVELQFNMDNPKERELLEYIDLNGHTRAGFIKSIIKQHINNPQPYIQTNNKPEQKNSSNHQKRRLPNLGTSYSTKDFED